MKIMLNKESTKRTISWLDTLAKLSISLRLREVVQILVRKVLNWQVKPWENIRSFLNTCRSVWPNPELRKSPLVIENPRFLSPPYCWKSHNFWTKNPTFWGIFFENLTPPTIFIAFLCINFFQILKIW